MVHSTETAPIISSQKRMTGQEIAHVLIDTVSRECPIHSDCVIACIRDHAASNNVAADFLKKWSFRKYLILGVFHTPLTLFVIRYVLLIFQIS